MTYLLDVNVLLSLVQREHVFHTSVAKWIKSLDFGRDLLASCSITELGVVRILPQIPDADYSVVEARHLLADVKAASQPPFTFLTDHLGVDHLPKWVQNPGQTTDGHLLELAKAHQAVLATCDRKIPGAFLIPA